MTEEEPKPTSSEAKESATESGAKQPSSPDEAPEAGQAEESAMSDEPKEKASKSSPDNKPIDSCEGAASHDAGEAPAGKAAKEPLPRGTWIRIIIAAACVALVAICAIATVVSTNYVEYWRAVSSYQTSAGYLQERNEALDQATSSLQLLVNSGAQPLEPELVQQAKDLIQEAKDAKDPVPPMPATTEEIRQTTNRIRISGNYAQLIRQLNETEDALEDSIALRELVVDPTASNVVERLLTVPHIIAAEAVTPENDPNGLLNQPEGYSAMVYFSYSLIIQKNVYGEGVIGKGTSGGGSVEVYPTVEQAQARNDYISQFDGTDLAPGYHEVVGSIVVRVSDRLTPERQKTLADQVVEALTTLPEEDKK